MISSRLVNPWFQSAFRRKFDWQYLFVFFFTILIFIPKVKYYVPYRFVGVFVVLWMGIALLRIFGVKCRDNSYFLLGVGGVSLFFALWFLMRGLSGDIYGELGYNTLVGLTLRVFPFVVFYYSLRFGRIKELMIVVLIIMLCLAYGSYSSTVNDYGITRFGARGSGETLEDDWKIADTIMSGGLNYALTYCTVIVFLAILANFFAIPLVFKVAFLPLMIYYVIGVYRAAYSTAVFQMALGVGLVAFSKVVSLRIFKVFAITGCTIIALSTSFPTLFSFMAEPLFSIARDMENEDLRMRVVAVAESVSGMESYSDARAKRYWQSYDQFLKHPIVGCFGAKILSGNRQEVGGGLGGDWIGGHSFLFDGMGGCGSIGFGIFVIGLAIWIKFLFSLFDRFECGTNAKKGLLCCLLSEAVVTAMNTANDPVIISGLFLAAPVIFLLWPSRKTTASGRRVI